MEKKNPILSVVVLLIIVAAAVAILFLVFKPSDNLPATKSSSQNSGNTTPEVTTVNVADDKLEENTTTTLTPSVATTGIAPTTKPANTSPAPTVKPTEKPSVTVAAGCETIAAVTNATVPANWKVIEFASLAYNAYRPTGYYYKLFSGMLAIDPNKIPDASEYAGVINIMTLSASNNYESYLANLEPSYKVCSREIDGRTVTTVEGKTKTSDAFAGQYIKYAKFTVAGKEYFVRLSNTNANYGGYADEYETFLTTLKFK